jgi:alpha,alpha-trehalose phosphorylase
LSAFIFQDVNVKPQHLSPPATPDTWRIVETRLDAGQTHLNETLFTLGNGYIGLRGAHEEGNPLPAAASTDGTYLNGFYDTEPIRYPENAYGLARTNQFMLNVPNAKCIVLRLEDELLDLSTGRLLDYERVLDLRQGVLERRLTWESPQGRQVAISSKRLVCLARKHVLGLRYEVKALNFSGRLQLVSGLDGNVSNVEAGDDPRVGSVISGPSLHYRGTELAAQHAALSQQTAHSGLTLVSAMSNAFACLAADGSPMARGIVSPVRTPAQNKLEQSYTVDIERGQAVQLTKFASYLSSRDCAQHALLAETDAILAAARAAGFAQLCEEQQQALDQFWSKAAVDIGGDDALLQGMRFNQFHLLQSAGRDGKTNIAAKGVTGEGYEGHYFWDTEIYIFPFFLYTDPAIARQLLAFRFSCLPAARARAREMSHERGALFPWRTISGEECSAYFPAGTAQYHINADIAYAVKLYLETTGDQAFLCEQGAEMVLESARIWMGIGCFIDGQFRINEVTGPDEYSALVNNNFYTNAMARMHLRLAAGMADTLAQQHPADHARITQAIGLDAGEVAAWRAAADAMVLPYDETLGIHVQDDGFLQRKRWDFANAPADKYPLLLHYHPLVIYRHQVCKQADVVLAMLLLSDQFSHEDKRRDVAYYEAVTTHDSSLSSCIFGIMASETGSHDKAHAYFMENARLDLDNTHGNTAHGVHTASMAGTWLGLVYGFGGLRLQEGKAHFSPALPGHWTHYSFRLQLHGCHLQVAVRPGQTEYSLLSGPGLPVWHRGREILLSPAAPVASAANEVPA